MSAPSSIPKITLRTPSSLASSPSSTNFIPPSPHFMAGKWHVTHSTLPMWKSKCNVCITYTPLPPASEDGNTDQTVDMKLDDLVEYETRSGKTRKSVHGVDTPTADGKGWQWRGKGWLKVASSRWEVLGWGEGEEGREWMVTYFAATLFTPAGMDVYSRRGEGVGERVLEGIMEEMKRLGAEDGKGEMGKLADSIFEVERN
ncbi:MAG: hypothetical protein Q9190_002817 [Brigantiaea leucoxantha]